MKKSKNLQLFLVFLVIISFFIWLAFRNEAKREKVYNSVETIKLKQPAEVKSPIINNEEGKG